MRWFKESKVNFKGQSGFTLVEVVIAIALLLFVLEAVIGAQYSSLSAGLSAQKRNQTVFLANYGLEVGRNAVLPATPVFPYYLENDVSVPNYDSVSRTIYLRNSPGVSGMLEIDVAVGWLDGAGVVRYVYTSSLRAPN